ncbi:uncharacterized protein LOC143694170 isoform X1 [Agelaius phoeniceus]|uniref:uncharacterized protein LOC143694170 isoform X1 n=1 Tax=Agelaius phoeniceus TaxID=39638 RepID=UPI004054C3B7
MKNPTDTDEAFLSEPWFVFYFQRENEKCCKKNWLCLTHAAFLVAVGKQYALALSPLLSTSCKNLFLMLQDFSKYNHFLKENQLDYTGKYLRKAEIIAPIITGEPEPVQFKRKNGAIERQDQRRTLFLRVISGIEGLHSIESFPSPLCT